MFRTFKGRRAIGAAASVLSVALLSGADGPVVAIEPFDGELIESSNQHGATMAVQVLPVFDGFGTLANLTPDGSIKVEFSSALGGDLVTPLSGMMCGQLGVGRWEFSAPVRRFGGWFENNSGADDATVEFFDADGALLDVKVAVVPVNAQTWTWNGWESAVPVSRIEVTGNGLINGFLWYEDMQVVLASTCASDLDADGLIGPADLALLIAAWSTDDRAADLSGDGVVDGADLGILLDGWGACAE